MKTFNLLYTDDNDLIDFIERNLEDNGNTYFVKIHTSDKNAEQAMSIAKLIKEEVPNSAIIGASVVGLIHNGEYVASGTLISFTSLTLVDVKINRFDCVANTTSRLAGMIIDEVSDIDAGIVYCYLPCNYTQQNSLLIQLDYLEDHHIPIVGGGYCVPETADYKPFVFTDEWYSEDNAATATIFGDDLKAFTSAINGNTPLSEMYTVTRVEGDAIVEIENTPAYDWFVEQLGMEDFSETQDYGDIFLNFPLITEQGGARFVNYDETYKTMSTINTTLEVGQKFRLGFSSCLARVDECKAVCKQMRKVFCEDFFIYCSPTVHKDTKQHSELDIKPYHNFELCGALMDGQFAPINYINQLQNGATVYAVISEDYEAIVPDFSVFDDLADIKDESSELINNVIKKQGKNSIAQNQKLVDKITQIGIENKQRAFIDNITGLMNATKFLVDTKDRLYDKMCLISLEQGQLLQAHFNELEYQELMQVNVDSICEYLATNNLGASFYIYALDPTTFFIVANENCSSDKFIEITKDMFEKHGTGEYGEDKISFLNRFTIVFAAADLLQNAKIALVQNASKPTHYIIHNSEYTLDNLADEMKKVAMINKIITEGGITPFYQGIYDNKLGRINNYEALMRLEYNGELYSPDTFMATAKKYNLYGKLSRGMIEKVLHNFDGKDQGVSVNLASHDILSHNTRDLILKIIKDMKDPSNITFEIVETDEFSDMIELRNFIDLIRPFGVKIAIDDYGAGYSNLTKVIDIAPDYIKIDGSIVKNIGKSQSNDKILAAVAFLGSQMDTELVAEFVEDEDIQNVVVNNSIRYSQGYLFSKPTPATKLELTENGRDSINTPLLENK